MSAVISDDGRYRYWLGRELRPVGGDGPAGLRRVVWLMFNPSTADAEKDDNTINRVRGFSAKWGFHQIAVVNLYAFRTAYPKDLAKFAGDRIGPDNDRMIKATCRKEMASAVVCAWGTHELARARQREVFQLIDSDVPTLCLGVTANGSPRHPLYLAADTKLSRFAIR